MSLCDDDGSRLEMDINMALSASSPLGGGGDESPDNIVLLEREFQQVRQHIRLLVQRKARLLQKIHKHKQAGETEQQQQQHIIDRWREVMAHYLYARTEDVLMEDDHTGACRFPLFNMLPNEVILRVFSYLGATHLCRTVMRTCTLFCAIALDESLWRPLYHLNWGDHRAHVVYSRTVDHVNARSEEQEKRGEGNEERREQLLTWRTLFTQQSCTERNWWRGRYSVNTFEGHKGAVRCMHFSGETLVTGSADKTVRLWTLNDGKCTTVLHDTKWIRCLRYDAPSSTLVTTGMDSTQAKIWDLTTNTVAHVLEVQRGWITSLQMSMPRIVTGSLDGMIRLWDAGAPTNPPYFTLNSGHDSLRSLCMQGDMIMSAGIERNLLLWDTRSRPTKPAATVEGAAQGNYCAKFDLQTNTVASGSNGIVAVGDLRKAKSPPLTLKGHTDVVSCLQFAGRKLVTGSMDQTARVWDVAEQRCAQTLHGHESWVWDLQFDPDKIATASGDKTVKLWEFNHPNRIAVL